VTVRFAAGAAIVSGRTTSGYRTPGSCTHTFGRPVPPGTK